MIRRHINKYVEDQNREIPTSRDSKAFKAAVGVYRKIRVSYELQMSRLRYCKNKDICEKPIKNALHDQMPKLMNQFTSALDIYNSEVQNAHRVALIGIVEKQWGHSLVVGSSAGASASRLRLLRPRMIRKTAKATMTKLMIVLINIP